MHAEAANSILSHLKGELGTRTIGYFIVTGNSDKIKQDLSSPDSTILGCIAEVLQFTLVIYKGHCNPQYFTPTVQSFRQGTPLVIQWNKTEKMFEETNLKQQKLSRYYSEDQDGVKPTKQDEVVDSRLKKLKRKKKAKLVSSDSSDSDNESYRNEKRRQNSDSSIGHDLSLSETDGFEDDEDDENDHLSVKQAGSKSSLDNDFLEELRKLENMQKKTKDSASGKQHDTDLKKMRDKDLDSQKIQKKKVLKVGLSEEVKNLEQFEPFSTLYLEKSKLIQANIDKFLEITDRLRKHVLVLQANLFPENMSTCLCCPIHCAQALVKATKDKRGPKKKI